MEVADSGRSKPMLPSAQSPRVAQDPQPQQPASVSVARLPAPVSAAKLLQADVSTAKTNDSGHRMVAAGVAKTSDPGHRKSTASLAVPLVQPAVSQPRLDEEPVMKLTPEHGTVRSKLATKICQSLFASTRYTHTHTHA